MFDDVLELEPSVQGVIRFVIEPAFRARQFHTFLYTTDAVLAALVIKGVGLWEVVPLAPNLTPDTVLVERLYSTLSRGVPNFQRLARSQNQPTGCCPEPINSWPKLRAWTVQAVACVAEGVLDGVGYWHVLEDRRGVLSALWSNPDRGFPIQADLASMYARLLATAQLTPRSLQLAFGVDDHLERQRAEAEELPDDVDDGQRDRSMKKRPKPWQRR